MYLVYYTNTNIYWNLSLLKIIIHIKWHIQDYDISLLLYFNYTKTLKY